MFRWRSVSTLLFLFVLSGPAQSSDTLGQLRADLSQGQLGVLLQRQAIVSLPAAVIKSWVQDQPIERFAITGFNESESRFAARLRLHFPSGEMSFVRLEGESTTPYTVTDWYDYSSGLRLTALLEQRRWLQGESGKAFLSELGEAPGSAVLADLAQGRPAALKLWLTQCLGKPCERIAAAHQLESEKPMLWQLRRAIGSGDLVQYQQQQNALLSALGDDPYLWWLEGQYALSYQQCAWLVAPLQSAWKRHNDRVKLADVALQCTLRDQPEATDFGDALLQKLTVNTVMSSVAAYFSANNRPVPQTWRDWRQAAAAASLSADQE